MNNQERSVAGIPLLKVQKKPSDKSGKENEHTDDSQDSKEEQKRSASDPVVYKESW